MRKGKGEGVTEADMDSVVHAHNCECLQATFLMLALALVSGGIDVLASRRPVKARLWHLHITTAQALVARSAKWSLQQIFTTASEAKLTRHQAEGAP